MLKVKLKRKVHVGSSRSNYKEVEIVERLRGGFSSCGPKMLLVFAGEAFRSGKSRERDDKKFFDGQRSACFSHVDFMDHIETAWGMKCDVMVNSYETKYEEDIASWYGDRLVASCYRRNLIGLDGLARAALSEHEISGYDCALISRIDIRYKDYMKSVFNPSWDRIMFPSMCWILQAYLSNWTPRVSDTMEFIPKRLLEFAKANFFLCHSSWSHYRNHRLPKEDMGFFLETYHDSDSAKDYNPLYDIVNRRASDKWNSPSLIVGEDLRPKRCFTPISFPDWLPAVSDSYEDESVLVAIKYDTTLQKRSFGISRAPGVRFISVRRLDASGGWDDPLTLLVRDKDNDREFDLYVGHSSENERVVSLDYRPNCFDGQRYRVEVGDAEVPDLFNLDFFPDGLLKTTRTDKPTGWGQNLMATITDKTSGRTKIFRVGPSDSNSKSVMVDLKPESFRDPDRIRVAFCLRGAVSRRSGNAAVRGRIYDASSDYIDFGSVSESIKKHILAPNGDLQIDVFIQSWNCDLRDQLKELYCPVDSLFEDNEMYADEIEARCENPRSFSGVSQALSIKRAIQLKESYERRLGFEYDMVVLYRPDVFIWKDIDLSKYDVSKGVYVNAHPGGNGDFHFVMSNADSAAFKGLYDSPLQGNPYRMHFWIKNYIEKYIGRKVIMDDIVPGRDQEVFREDKMNEAMKKYKI